MDEPELFEPSPDSALTFDPGFRLFVSDGFAGTIGGTGIVFGTAGFQDIALGGQSGAVIFDPSFNSGEDVIRFPDAAATYTVRLSGSSAVIENQDCGYTIPIGTAGTGLIFADGVRTLIFDGDAGIASIGDQAIAADAAAIAAPAELSLPPPEPDPAALGRLFLAEGTNVAVGGDLSAFGTTGSETVSYLSGDLILDPSFNRGGDTLVFLEQASGFTAYRSGSTIALRGAQGSVSIPVGLAGMTLDFAGEQRQLVFDEATSLVTIGGKAITASASDKPDLLVGYSAVHIFGDSLVDAGNALGLAEWYDGLPLTDLPDGTPTAELGYYEGRFSNGYTYADIITNSFLGKVSQPVFPYGYEEPFLGIPISPFEPEPKDNNLNWAYGGAQIIKGGEAVLDLDEQTDAYRDAADGEANPAALYLITMGGNDVRDLVPHGGEPAGEVEAHAKLDRVAAELLDELDQLFDLGARHFLITGIPDVGLIPRYDINANRILDSDPQDIGEAERSAIATAYSSYLDALIRTEVVAALEDLGADVTYVPLADIEGDGGNVLVPGVLPLVLPTIAQLNGLTVQELTGDILGYQELLFFDQIHPNAQLHALVGAQLFARLTGTSPVETLPLDASALDYSIDGAISTAGEVDEIEVELVASTTYTFQMLGVSSLGQSGTIADPAMRIFDPSGAEVSQFAPGSGNDSGLGFDASFTFTASQSGSYSFELSGEGSLTGAYVFQGGAQAAEGFLAGPASLQPALHVIPGFDPTLAATNLMIV
ncbi:MAG: SGNH/GDSL hydrolase family protein [Novosphingobium sp.]